jgi:hypothetical protein
VSSDARIVSALSTSSGSRPKYAALRSGIGQLKGDKLPAYFLDGRRTVLSTQPEPTLQRIEAAMQVSHTSLHIPRVMGFARLVEHQYLYLHELDFSQEVR